MKEKFIPAELDFVMFEHQDVITTSSDSLGDNALPDHELS